MDRVNIVTEGLDHSGTAEWYRITIAGKEFNISSRHGEGHIRKVERLLAETVEEMKERADGKSQTMVALLTALNLADQLVAADAHRATASQALIGRLEHWLHRLDDALEPGGHPGGAGSPQPAKPYG